MAVPQCLHQAAHSRMGQCRSQYSLFPHPLATQQLTGWKTSLPAAVQSTQAGILPGALCSVIFLSSSQRFFSAFCLSLQHTPQPVPATSVSPHVIFSPTGSVCFCHSQEAQQSIYFSSVSSGWWAELNQAAHNPLVTVFHPSYCSHSCPCQLSVRWKTTTETVEVTQMIQMWPIQQEIWAMHSKL